MKPILPREKIELWGVESLTDNELIQTILGTGTARLPLPDLAQRCLAVLDLPPKTDRKAEVSSVPGMGAAKTSRLLSALEFARRYSIPPHTRMKSPQDLFGLIKHYAQRPQETFLVVPLNGACEILNVERVSTGLLNRTLVHPREVFAPAIEHRAAQVAIAHNHPSGNLEPSPEDIEVTKKLVDAGRILGIEVLDHIIFSEVAFFSFREHNLMEG